MSAERYPDVTVTTDPQPSDAPFRLGVEVLNGFSPDAPARVRVSFENCGTDRTVGFGPLQPFSEIWDEAGVLVLVPTERAVQRYALGTDERILPDRPIDGCWKTRPVRFVRHDVLRWRTLDTGERIRAEYAVLHYPEREIADATGAEWFGSREECDGCLPAGEYRFEESFPPEVGAETGWNEFAWGFSLALSE